MGRLGSGQWGVAAAIAVASAAASLAWSPPAAASPYIHAHRGGPLESSAGVQRAARAEATLATFRAAARRGFVLEVDVKLTSDRVPVAIHDATLERTTNCSGRIDAITAAELRRRCVVDVAGTAGTVVELARGDSRRAPVPTLAAVLRMAKRHRAEVNMEIKNLPTEPDFDAAPRPSFARDVLAAVKAVRFPSGSLIVQSFWPFNLDVVGADPYFAEAETALLTLREMNAGGPAVAAAGGYDWVSPGWPVDQAYVSAAHALGLQVVPYTLDAGAEIREAARIGVDAVISNDARLARRVVGKLEPPPPKRAPRPRAWRCRELAAETLTPPIESFHPDDRGPRVFAMQFKHELRHVRTYEAFREKIECMVREYVVPRLARDRPNVVAFNEDVGLMTLATGSRGAAARALFEDPSRAPSCEPQGVPCGVVAALGAARAGYAKESALYAARFPSMPQVGATFVAGTDTFARGWMQLFSDLAKRYDVYILGSNNQARFRESRDPAEIAAFADPDLPRPQSVYIATDPAVYNEVFMWAPEDVRKEGPRPLRNVVVSNRKVPVTPIEEVIEIQPAPSSGPDAIENLRPYRIPGTRARIGFATSKPAFEYGHDLGEPPPPGGPCADVSVTYMRCLDRLGTTVVMQDEANPGRWTGESAEGNWTPLEWMRSTWRAVADPDVAFAYNVTPHLVGNLADLPFDGQTAITQRSRGSGGASCTYVGNRVFRPDQPEGDAANLRIYAGSKHHFLGLLPWVAPDGERDALRAAAAARAPGSGHARENDYVEGALIADLPFPVDRDRPRCNGGSVPARGACANLAVGTFGADALRAHRHGGRLAGLAGDDRLRGGPGADCIRGGPGADLIVGGPGRDRLRGGRGNDTIDARDGERDVVHCGPGRDRVRADRLDRVHHSCERIDLPRPRESA